MLSNNEGPEVLRVVTDLEGFGCKIPAWGLPRKGKLLQGVDFKTLRGCCLVREEDFSVCSGSVQKLPRRESVNLGNITRL